VKRVFTWKLAVLMALRGISTATDLARRLTASGHTVTPKHAASIVKEMPRRLDAELLQALVNLLDCSLDELLGLTPPAALTGATAAKPATMEVPPAQVATGDVMEERLHRLNLTPTPAGSESEPVPSDGITPEGTGRESRDRLKDRPAIVLPPTPLF
jgi:hypothetical protein